MNLQEAFRSFDWVLTGAAILLILLGLAVLFSSASDDVLFSSRFNRQTISFSIALVTYFIVSLIPYHKYRRYAMLIYAITLIGLFVVFQVGQVIRGTTSRLEVIDAQIQPSEFMKIGLVLALSWLFAKWSITQKITLPVSALLAGSTVTLVLLEPDVGTAALLAGVWVGYIVYLGVPWRTIALIGLLGLVSLFGVWQWVFAEYQKQRIITFLDPTSDPLGAGYNIVQSIVAIGSGGLIGRGLGHGPQSQLKFLPEQHTDFIFASIGEELGFVGIILMIVLYSTLLWRIIKIGQAIEDRFGRNLTIGVFAILLLSFFVSAGMNMGILPVTGIPLPLISYGGSNLLSTLILLAIVQSVHLYSTWVRQPPSELAHLT